MASGMKMELRRTILTLALEIAAEQYDKDAARGGPFAAQFAKQAKDAREAASDIEDADVIYLKDA